MCASGLPGSSDISAGAPFFEGEKKRRIAGSERPSSASRLFVEELCLCNSVGGGRSAFALLLLFGGEKNFMRTGMLLEKGNVAGYRPICLGPSSQSHEKKLSLQE